MIREAQMLDVRRVACVGRRDLSERTAELLHRIGQQLAAQGRTIVSGNATGSDQAYAAGANAVKPTLVELWLPWPGFERTAIVIGNVVRICEQARCFEIAAAHHPAWDRLSQGARRLFARNVGIVEGADIVLALPNHQKPGGGGTGHAMRLARAMEKRVVDLATEEGLREVRRFVAVSCG